MWDRGRFSRPKKLKRQQKPKLSKNAEQKTVLPTQIGKQVSSLHTRQTRSSRKTKEAWCSSNNSSFSHALEAQSSVLKSCYNHVNETRISQQTVPRFQFQYSAESPILQLDIHHLRGSAACGVNAKKEGVSPCWDRGRFRVPFIADKLRTAGHGTVPCPINPTRAVVV